MLKMRTQVGSVAARIVDASGSYEMQMMKTGTEYAKQDTDLRLGAVWYPVTTLGYGKRLGVWFQGCHKRCEGCISPEFQDPDGGRMLSISALDALLCSSGQADGLTVSGGEPFDQPEGLLKLVRWFSENYGDDILIFTGYTLEELREKNSPKINEILERISVLVDGEYAESLYTEIGMRGSSNQRIHVWKNKDRYQDIYTMKRTLQCVLQGERVWMIGIPS